MLRRKTMYLDDYTCVFCTCQDDETITHLFLNCPFSQQCWISIGLHIQSNLGPLAVLEDLRRQIAEPFFMEVITLMSWSIWTARNNFIFKNEAFSIQGTKNAFIKEFALVIQRAKKKYFPNIVQWLQSQAQLLVSSGFSFLFLFSCKQSVVLLSFFFFFSLIYNQQGITLLLLPQKKRRDKEKI